MAEIERQTLESPIHCISLIGVTGINQSVGTVRFL